MAAARKKSDGGVTGQSTTSTPRKFDAVSRRNSTAPGSKSMGLVTAVFGPSHWKMHYRGEKLGQIWEEVIGFWPLTKAFLLFGPPTSVHQNRTKIATIGARTDRQKDASGFIICPVICYIARGQIIKTRRPTHSPIKLSCSVESCGPRPFRTAPSLVNKKRAYVKAAVTFVCVSTVVVAVESMRAPPIRVTVQLTATCHHSRSRDVTWVAWWTALMCTLHCRCRQHRLNLLQCISDWQAPILVA